MQKIMLILLAGLLACCQHKRTYQVVVHTGGNPVTIDGVSDDAVWQGIHHIALSNPWGEHSPKTTLKLTADSRNLYFFFDVDDDEILLVPVFANKRDVEKEDRVELFFSKDKKMNDYYCFEIDAAGRTLTYRCSHYRIFDFCWEPPAGFHVVCQIRPGGYSVGGCIPMDFLSGFVQKGNKIYFGAYRAEFSKKDDQNIETWQSWINPFTSEPDFHVPASLGVMILK